MDSGTDSLRDVLTRMHNDAVSPNTIEFQITGSKLISLSTQLPTIDRSVSINTMAHVSGIILDGGGFNSGLIFAETTTNGSNVYGLEIRNFGGNGITISPAANELVNIQACHIHHNDGSGVSILSGKNHSITTSSLIENNNQDGVFIGSSVQGVHVFNSEIRDNIPAGIRLAGSSHEVSGCFIWNNGVAETGGANNGGVVFASATDCQVHDSTLALNTPYGAKLVSGTGNKLLHNETYRNITKGYYALTNVPVLSHFVIDTVHSKVILLATITGPANEQVTAEFFARYNVNGITSDQGSVVYGNALVQLDASGQAFYLASLNQTQTWKGELFPGGRR